MSEKLSELTVIIMGSKSDKGYGDEIAKVLTDFEVPHVLRIASAHKSTDYLLELVSRYQQRVDKLVFIAVAGRSNALGGIIDAATPFPVISAPPYSEKYGGMDLLSSLRMPSGLAAMVAIEAEAAALAAVKIFALSNNKYWDQLVDFHKSLRNKIMEDDLKLLSSQGKNITDPTLQVV